MGGKNHVNNVFDPKHVPLKLPFFTAVAYLEFTVSALCDVTTDTVSTLPAWSIAPSATNLRLLSFLKSNKTSALIGS